MTTISRRTGEFSRKYKYALTGYDPRVLVLVLVRPPHSVPGGVHHLAVPDGAVKLELHQHRVLPPLCAVLVEVGHGHGALVQLRRHAVFLRCGR